MIKQKRIKTSAGLYPLMILLLFTLCIDVNAKKKNVVIIGDTITNMFVGNGKHTKVKLSYHPKSGQHIIYTTYNGKQIKSEESYLVLSKEVSFQEWRGLVRSGDILRDKESKYHHNGALSHIYNYEKGARKSVTSYFSDGSPKTYYELEKGERNSYLRNGDYKEWNEQGRLVIHGAYKKHQRHGEFVLLSNDNMVIRRGVYKKDKLVEGQAVFRKTFRPDRADKYPELIPSCADDLASVLSEVSDSSLVFEITINEKGYANYVRLLDPQKLNNVDTINTYFKSNQCFEPAQKNGQEVARAGYFLATNENHKWRFNWSQKKNVVEPNSDKVFMDVEVMPEFPGGGEGLRRYIRESVKYPIEAQKSKIQGRVYVSFVVDVDGSVTDIEVARGVDYDLDKEAVRVVMQMPKWKPGKQKGKNVRVNYTIPINFHLK